MGVAKDAYNMMSSFCFIYAVVTNLIASTTYAELRRHKKDSGIQMVPHCRSCHYRLQILLGHMATSCQECKSNQLEELAKIGDVVPSNKLPSQVIADAFKQHKEIPSEAELSDLTAKVFLHPDEVQVLLKHVQSASENRKERERKAAQKMRKAC